VSLTDGPSFKLPCNHQFSPSTEWEKLLKKLARLGDVNELIQFPCPECDNSIELYVALHLFPDGTTAICIPRSDEEGAAGIPSEWWKVSVA